MAIEKMKKLQLIVPKEHCEALFHALIRAGCVEMCKLTPEAIAEDADRLSYEESNYRELSMDRSTMEKAIDILSKASPQKTKLLTPLPEVADQTLLALTDPSAIQIAENTLEIQRQLNQIDLETGRIQSSMAALTPWVEMDLPLEMTTTVRCSLTPGILPRHIEPARLYEVLDEVTQFYDCRIISSDAHSIYVLLIALKEEREALLTAARSVGLDPVDFQGFSGKPAEVLKDLEKQNQWLSEKKNALKQELLQASAHLDLLKLCYDQLSNRMALEQAREQLVCTEKTDVLSGWAPADRESALEKIFEEYHCAWEMTEPREEEYSQVPVSLKNNRFTNSLNMVTNMYSLPAYGTVDPNPLMAPFFILFFGLMMADMGYGMIMVAAGLVALKKMKPQGNSLALCQLLLYSGVATFVMGFLTGGFFSDIPYQIVHLIHPDSSWSGLWSLFSPEKDSTLVLYGSLVLGLLHLNTGMAVSFVQKIKAGNTAGAIWEEGSLWVLLIGIILFVFNIGSIAGIPVVLVMGVVMLLFGAGRKANGFGKVTAAFGCIYNTATGWFGDVLSYSRIMALMLAGGVVGKVFNTVAIMPAQSNGINVITVIAFVVIFVLGHAMNFALNLLGCYVHDLRLQCLEFFGKFYVDGGRPFRPLHLSGKYMSPGM